jgi:DNA polymerase-3 subunit epsilon
MTAYSEPTDMREHQTELDEMAAKLSATGDYKVLRRLVPRAPTPTPTGYGGKFGVVIDFETTGLDPTRDEIIEVAALTFRYERDGITGVADTFQAFNEPSAPIPAEITELTGISDAMVAGQKIDKAEIERFVADANIVIAHNAEFDRKFAERSWSFFEQKHWGCSSSEIDWKKHGFGGAKLGYLLADAGFFHGAHRAIDDCMAVLELLARPLPNTPTTAFAVLLERARRKTFRIWAQNSPYDLKDTLKRRKYRWNDGTDGRPRSWHVDVDEDKCDAELIYLRKEIYQRDVDILCCKITARERFSSRAASLKRAGPRGGAQ